MYTIDNQSLDCVPFIMDLGVTVSNDLSWSRHIESIVAKANKTLGLVKRVCKELPDLKVYEAPCVAKFILSLTYY